MRRWAAGAASLGLVALALLVGLKLAGEEREGVTASPIAAGGSMQPRQRSDHGEAAVRAADSCTDHDRSCGPVRAQVAARRDPAEAGSPESGGSASTAAATNLSPQEAEGQPVADQPNINPDHYGPGGEPEPEPGGPTAEGTREATAPNRNPDH